MNKKRDRIAQPLTNKEAAFARFYVSHYNHKQAALDAGYSVKTAGQQACALIKRPHIQAEIAKLSKPIAQKFDLDAGRVLEKLWSIASCDVNDIVQVRRGACRHCWGVEFLPMETVHERRERLKEYNAAVKLNNERKTPLEMEPFDVRGGIGYDRTRLPNVECPECHGGGFAYVYIHDTRKLSPAALALYAGAKQTKDGIEVKLGSRDKALELLGSHFGLFVQITPPVGDVGTFNQQNNLYALSTEQLYEIIRRGSAAGGGGGNSAPAKSIERT